MPRRRTASIGRSPPPARSATARSAGKPSTFNHDRFFLLDRDHNAACATCHTNNDFTRYTCFGCHEHTPANIRAEHEEEGIRNVDNCVSCHRSADDEGGERGGGREDD